MEAGVVQRPEDGWLRFGGWRGDGVEKAVCGVGEECGGVGLGEGRLGVDDA